jgi:hypothetical protein
MIKISEIVEHIQSTYSCQIMAEIIIETKCSLYIDEMHKQ